MVPAFLVAVIRIWCSAGTAWHSSSIRFFFVPAWTVVNAGAGYTYDRYTVHLNLDNLLSRHFFWDPASRLSVPMYDGLTARATFTVKF
jgi:outer membrane receptor protein involved in Fe transport